MRAYWAIVSARYRMLLQYRAAAIAGFATQVFWGLIKVMIFAAFYRASRSPQPMSYAEVVTYVWLGQAMLRMLPWDIEGDIRQMIRSGAVAYELLRPLDLYALWYARALAWRTAPTTLRALPMFVLAMACFGMQWPASAASGLAWAAATVGALCLACAVTTLLSVSLLWTIAGDGAARLIVAGVIFLSGMIVPLPLFPDWAQTIVGLLPFRGIVDLPFRLYTGHIPPEGVWGVLGHQLAWTVGLVAFGRWLLARGTRRLVVQGG